MIITNYHMGHSMYYSVLHAVLLLLLLMIWIRVVSIKTRIMMLAFMAVLYMPIISDEKGALGLSIFWEMIIRALANGYPYSIIQITSFMTLVLYAVIVEYDGNEQ